MAKHHSLTPRSPNQGFIDDLLDNKITYTDLIQLCENALPEDLTQLTVRLFDMEESKLLKQVAVTGGTAYLNKLKNKQRTKRYEKKIQKSNGDFRKNGIVILAEGDSWFNYPIILSDVIDWISMEPDIALYSLAEGADWLLNMLIGREYVAGLGIHDPDYLLLSGGGNDIVGLSRIAVIVSKYPDPLLSCYYRNEFVQRIMHTYTSDTAIFKHARFTNGLQYLNKDFFALLMLFKVQYHFIIGKLIVPNKKESKYPELKILTQGYDFVIPDDKEGFGLDIEKWYVPVLRQINHGKWLKFPLLLKGISDSQTQKDILYAMIFLFNEMLISVGEYFYTKGCRDDSGRPRLIHIDCRGKIEGWTDELHPQPAYFKKVAKLYIQCIKGQPTGNPLPYVFS